ncbi:MAG: AbrB/MazE/SpoVT family DNA-binding domain-containing protein [Promethearchaeota archaeon]
MAEIAKGKFIFGTVKVGERGQIVIPKEARKTFGIEPGDILFVAGDINKGIAITKVTGLKGYALKALGAFGSEDNDEKEES